MFGARRPERLLNSKTTVYNLKIRTILLCYNFFHTYMQGIAFVSHTYLISNSDWTSSIDFLLWELTFRTSFLAQFQNNNGNHATPRIPRWFPDAVRAVNNDHTWPTKGIATAVGPFLTLITKLKGQVEIIFLPRICISLCRWIPTTQ